MVRRRVLVWIGVIGVIGFGAWGVGQVTPGTGSDQSGQGQQGTQQPLVMVATPPPPATRVEKMMAVTGAVVLKGYTEVGEVDGESGSGVHVVAIEVTNTGSGEKVYGLAIGVRAVGNGNVGEVVTYVDADEIDALAKGMDYLGRLQPANMGGAMQEYEAHYKSKAELEVSNFDSNGARMTGVRAIQVAPITGQVVVATAYFTPQRLLDVEKQVAAGKEAMEKARGGKG